MDSLSLNINNTEVALELAKVFFDKFLNNELTITDLMEKRDYEENELTKFALTLTINQADDYLSPDEM